METLQISCEEDIFVARLRLRDFAKLHEFGLVDQTRLVTAASELARNIQRYATRGEISMERVAAAGRIGIRLTFRDHGPGIENIEQAMTDGFTTSRGLGKGLPGSKRLVDEFDIQSEVGHGTTVTITKWNTYNV